MEQKKGYLMVLAAGVMWGSIGLFTTELSQYGMSAGQIAFLRLAAGTVLLGVLLLVTKGRSAFRMDWRGLFWCVLLGIFAEALFNLSYTRAVTEAGMALGAVLLYTAPIFVSFMSWLFFRETFTKNKLIALGINVIGCAMAVTGGNLAGLQIPAAGLAAGLAAGFFYGTFTIISTAALKEYDPLTVLFYGMLIGAVILGAVSRPWQILPQAANPRMLAVVAGFGLIPTCAAYALYMMGLSRKLETSKVPVICSIEIVAAALIGTTVLGQGMSFGKIAGILIILLSIVLMNTELRKPEALRSCFRRPAARDRV